VFSTSGWNTVTVGSDASGMVAAPTFTANDTQGSYTVTASSQYGFVPFSLTNTDVGIPAKITAIPLKRRSASVTGRYPQPLQVKALDSGGNPVAGATITFTLATGNASACGTSTSPSASFIGGGTQATASTGANGVATSPAFTANTTAGSFTATAAVSGKEPSGGSGKEASAGSGSGAAAPASFVLSNLAGKPTKLATGVGATQSAIAGTPFPLRLAVTVTDAEKNPVPDAQIAFSAPAHHASGSFTTHARGSHHHRSHTSHSRTVQVKTNACGIAVAPVFTANDQQGGYIVKASVKHAKTAAFALVNEAP
jgi:protocatechuate 3,4-dioxygenase beta subunit